MVPDEFDNVFLTDTVDVVSTFPASSRSLEAVLKPSIVYPFADFVVVLTEAQFQLAHCVAVAHAAGSAEALQFVHN